MRISLWIKFPSFVDIMSGGLFKLHIAELTNEGNIQQNGKFIQSFMFVLLASEK